MSEQAQERFAWVIGKSLTVALFWWLIAGRHWLVLGILLGLWAGELLAPLLRLAEQRADPGTRG